MTTALKSIGELPQLQKRTDDRGDHDYLAGYAAMSPVVRDRFGMLMCFSYENLVRIIESDKTRQPETDALPFMGISGGPILEFFSNTLLLSNGETHKRRRTPLARSFARPLMEAMRADVRALAETLIGPEIGRGETDFLEAIAGPLPARVIAGILGVPDTDIPHFTRLVYSAIRVLTIRSKEVLEEAAADLEDLNTYVRGLFGGGATHTRNDFLSAYLERTEGSGLSEDEIRMQIVSIILAGADTTRIALSSTVSQLCKHPDQWALLKADPHGMKAAVASEGLRFDPVIGTIGQITLEPFELDGIAIPKNMLIGGCMITALRDPKVYADPDRFDVTRTDHPRWHPVFGAGAHRCLGEALARVELEEALAVLAERSDAPTLVGPPPVLRGLGGTRSITAMKVAL